MKGKQNLQIWKTLSLSILRKHEHIKGVANHCWMKPSVNNLTEARPWKNDLPFPKNDSVHHQDWLYHSRLEGEPHSSVVTKEGLPRPMRPCGPVSGVSSHCRLFCSHSGTTILIQLRYGSGGTGVAEVTMAAPLESEAPNSGGICMALSHVMWWVIGFWSPQPRCQWAFSTAKGKGRDTIQDSARLRPRPYCGMGMFTQCQNKKDLRLQCKTKVYLGF